ncbi:hypothetical protein C8J57DRAFT_1090377 [Mycena rebaudengoi]|nr:hypothetical protein C8J57DRAFT_1090377 [Mycena rebaudengoi]
MPAPAEEVVSYYVKKFDKNEEGAITEYMGSGSAVDRAWHELYEDGQSIISPDEASRFSNWTQAALGFWTRSLTVFHNLHCLNMLRMTLYPSIYNFDALLDTTDTISHLSHCIDSVRQAVQCAADISPMIGRYNTKNTDARLVYHGASDHWCSDFEKVKEWANERKPTAEFKKADSKKEYLTV